MKTRVILREDGKYSAEYLNTDSKWVPCKLDPNVWFDLYLFYETEDEAIKVAKEYCEKYRIKQQNKLAAQNYIPIYFECKEQQ